MPMHCRILITSMVSGVGLAGYWIHPGNIPVPFFFQVKSVFFLNQDCAKHK